MGQTTGSYFCAQACWLDVSGSDASSIKHQTIRIVLIVGEVPSPRLVLLLSA